MNDMIAFLALGGAAIIVVIAAVVVQKKSGEVKRLAAELAAMQLDRDESRTRLAELVELEERFEEKVDDVVKSSIQKIAHAEEAKEEAVKAAQDNYEAAAEAHALLREKEAIIKELQSKVS